MTYRWILPMALLLCFSIRALSVNYDLLWSQLRSSNSACQKLLWQLNGAPQRCPEDTMNFQFPEEIEQAQQFQKEDAALVFYEMLQHTLRIFRRNFASTGWNETIVKNLLVEVHLQMDRLETNLKGIMEEESSTWGNTTILRLKKYYGRISHYLKAEKYSHCAWTVVQAEMLRSLAFLNGLIDYLQD
ncbi:interferon beta-like [Equus asinus]|uniref:Interferon beta n=1 Tax=Equus asinus TaxID=9793 RepID=A0A9L0J3Q7_EQUAS|nr:interferon beta-like [Equus asinus]